MEADRNFIRNMLKVLIWCKEDQDMSIQVLEFEKDGERVYFQPVKVDVDKDIYAGIFMPDKRNAMILKGYIDTLSKNPEQLKNLNPSEMGIDGIFCELKPSGDGKFGLSGVGYGTYKELAARDEYFMKVYDFLNQGEIQFHSLDKDNATDLKSEDAILQELLGTALAFYKYSVNASNEERLYEIKSPKSDRSAVFSVINPSAGVSDDSAVFCLFPNLEKLEEFANNVYDIENPAEIGGSQDLMFLEIFPKEGSLTINDIPRGNILNLDNEGKREIIMNFLQVLEEVYTYALSQQ